MMRILTLCDALSYGGAETHIVTLITELKKTGADITVISAGGAYEDSLTALGVTCIRAPLDKRDPLSILKSFRIIKKYMRAHDIVHAHTRLTAVLARLARRGGYPKILVTAHLDFKRCGVGRFSYFGDLTLAVSEDIREHLSREFKLPKEKIRITRNGIDLNRFRRMPEGGDVMLTHVSRLDSDRADAAFMLVKIAPMLLLRFPTLKIKIVGEGECFDELRVLAEEANAEIGCTAIALTGGRADIESIVGGSTVFVGVSRAALEAMALGVPTVIAGNDGYGGILCKETLTNLVKTNLCARGFEKLTEQNLLRDIVWLLEDKRRRLSLSDEQYKLVCRLYTSKRMAEDALSAYASIYRPPRVAVLGYFGFGNIGDELTLRHCISAITERGVKEISVFTAAPLPHLSSARAVPRGDLFKIISTLKRTDTLVLGGGNLIQNESSLLSLLYYTLFIMLAGALGCRVYFLSSGIGALTGGVAKMLARRAVKRADFIGARTSSDALRFRSYGGENIHLMPDLCFLCFKKRSIYAPTEVGGGYTLVIAKCLGAPTLEYIRRLTSGGSAVFVTTSDKSDGERIRDECERLGLSYLPQDTPDKLLSLIGGARLAVSERLHGAILSLALCVPAVISEDSEKHLDLLKEIGGRCKAGEEFLFPIQGLKKEVGPQGSDLLSVLGSLCGEIERTLDKIF
ncbi:MAG: glycosyltransferase [Clostridia bacterium]|nr:glycosyltransferase [Clostridia bacterium]